MTTSATGRGWETAKVELQRSSDLTMRSRIIQRRPLALWRPRRQRARGFTLLEATIALAVLGLAAMVVLPTMGSLGKADLRKAASRVAATVRQAYGFAALSGRTYRLALDLEKATVTVESTTEVLSLGAENELPEPGQDTSDVFELLGLERSLRDDDEDAESEISAAQALFGAARGRESGSGEERFEKEASWPLGDGIRFLDVWVEGAEKPTAQGLVYLYFFPHGYTQDAIVHLTIEDGDTSSEVYSVRTWALTGKAQIEGRYREAPK